LVLIFIVAANFIAERFCPAPAKRITVVLTAGLPIIVAVALIAKFAHRDGLSATFEDAYFFLFLLLVGVGTLATTATALLGQSLAQGKRR
jgi:hypothetical protein